MADKIRVRFAPSPTGPLHIGGVRTALYNFLFARKNGGDFILRIEDTDQLRYVADAEKYVIDVLKWCRIEPNEGVGFGDGPFGPYRQSERTAVYQKYTKLLLDSGNAYYAFDTPSELDEKRKEAEKRGERFQYDVHTRSGMNNSLTMTPDQVQKQLQNGNYVVRFKIPEGEDVKFHDVVREEIVYNTSELDDKIIMKADGFPTYHLANVVDDHLMDITHVIRGEEWLPSTPLHVLLYRAFGWNIPVFAHLPLILNPSGKGKLSKRDGAKFGFPVFPLNWNDPESDEVFKGYKETGFTPEAFLNMLALLGWHSSEEQEIFTIKELVDEFSLERVVKSGARFDFEKARWLSQQHLIRTDDEVIGKQLREILKEKGKDVSHEYAEAVSSIMKERVHFVSEIPEAAEYLFGKVQSYDEKMIRKKFKTDKLEMYLDLTDRLEALPEFTAANIESTIKSFLEEKELGFGAILPVVRLCVSGTVQGPSVFVIMELLGKPESITRMRESLHNFSKSEVN